MKNIKQDLEKRASALEERLRAEEQQKAYFRQAGRAALDQADTLLQSVEMSLASPDGVALTARAGRPAPLPPISTRPASTDE
jgi:hypothetical protein